MAAKALRQRTRRGSRQDANNVNVPAEARPPKEEKACEESKLSEARQEWVWAPSSVPYWLARAAGASRLASRLGSASFGNNTVDAIGNVLIKKQKNKTQHSGFTRAWNTVRVKLRFCHNRWAVSRCVERCGSAPAQVHSSPPGGRQVNASWPPATSGSTHHHTTALV